MPILRHESMSQRKFRLKKANVLAPRERIRNRACDKAVKAPPAVERLTNQVKGFQKVDTVPLPRETADLMKWRRSMAAWRSTAFERNSMDHDVPSGLGDSAVDCRDHQCSSCNYNRVWRDRRMWSCGELLILPPLLARLAWKSPSRHCGSRRAEFHDEM